MLSSGSAAKKGGGTTSSSASASKSSRDNSKMFEEFQKAKEALEKAKREVEQLQAAQDKATQAFERAKKESDDVERERRELDAKLTEIAKKPMAIPKPEDLEKMEDEEMDYSENPEYLKNIEKIRQRQMANAAYKVQRKSVKIPSIRISILEGVDEDGDDYDSGSSSSGSGTSILHINSSTTNSVTACVELGSDGAWDDSDVLSLIAVDIRDFVGNSSSSNNSSGSGFDAKRLPVINDYFSPTKLTYRSLYMRGEAPEESFEYTVTPTPIKPSTNSNAGGAGLFHEQMTLKMKLPSYCGYYVLAYIRIGAEGDRLVIGTSNVFSVYNLAYAHHPDDRGAAAKNAAARSMHRRSAVDLSLIHRNGGIGNVNNMINPLTEIVEDLTNICSINIFVKPAMTLSFITGDQEHINADICVTRGNFWTFYQSSSSALEVVIESDVVLMSKPTEEDNKNGPAVSVKTVYNRILLPAIADSGGKSSTRSGYDLSNATLSFDSKGFITCRIPYFKNLAREDSNKADIQPYANYTAPNNDGWDSISCRFCCSDLFSIRSIVSAKVLPSGAFDSIMTEMVCCELPSHINMHSSGVSVPSKCMLMDPLSVSFQVNDLIVESNDNSSRNATNRGRKLNLKVSKKEFLHPLDALNMETMEQSLLKNATATSTSTVAAHKIGGGNCSSSGSGNVDVLLLKKQSDNKNVVISCDRCRSHLGLGKINAKDLRGNGDIDISQVVEIKLLLHNVSLGGHILSVINDSKLIYSSYSWQNINIDIENAVSRMLLRLSSIYSVSNVILYNSEESDNLNASDVIYIKLINKDYRVSALVSCAIEHDESAEIDIGSLADNMFSYRKASYNFKGTNVRSTTTTNNTSSAQHRPVAGVKVLYSATRPHLSSHIKGTEPLIALQSHEFESIFSTLSIRGKVLGESPLSGLKSSVLRFD